MDPRLLPLGLTPDIITALAAHTGTPLAVYSHPDILDRYQSLTHALPAGAVLAYSVKANPNPDILRTLCEIGAFAEVASIGELELLRQIGFPPARILVGAPYKTPELITLGVELGVAAFLVESPTDFDRIRAYAALAHKRQRVLIRVNPSQLDSTSALRMAGVPSQFGFDEDTVASFLSDCRPGPLEVAGLFLYAGSQHRRESAILNNTRHLLDLTRHLHQQGVINPTMLDFGGGFGVPEDRNDLDELDPDTLSAGFTQIFSDPLLSGPTAVIHTAVFESGRYLVNRAGVLVGEIVDIKRSHGQTVVITNIGITNLGVRSPFLRTFDPPVFVCTPEVRDRVKVTLTGPTCTPIDVICQNVEIADPRIGDLILIPRYGAYSITYSPNRFCGWNPPHEIMWRPEIPIDQHKPTGGEPE